ncbi:MAG: HutD family protein [Bacteroidales bacterium]|nr:HutD family protein [Bacteroidales bacterium]
MNTFILEEKHFQQIKWSGGISTQLYISPVDAGYSERNFEVRISTAKVEIGKSNFTSLPGIERKLMILEGEILINHENHYSKKMKQFDVDSFSGDWNTTSVGTCTDFNVMTTGNIKSELSILKVVAKSTTKINISKQSKTLFLYAFKGNIDVEINQVKYILKKGNLLVVENIKVDLISLFAEDQSEIVVTKIF